MDYRVRTHVSAPLIVWACGIRRRDAGKTRRNGMNIEGRMLCWGRSLTRRGVHGEGQRWMRKRQFTAARFVHVREALMPLIETEVRQLKQTKVQRQKVENSLDTIGPNEVRRKEAEKTTCPPPRYSGVERRLHHRLGGIRHGVILLLRKRGWAMGSNGERNRATDYGDYSQIGTDYGNADDSSLLCVNLRGYRFVDRVERQSQAPSTVGQRRQSFRSRCHCSGSRLRMPSGVRMASRESS